ncbi:antiviral reverse transcriptase Drt2 [Chitinimonas sp. BJYL2]|uniref:antiviral reverse transcriptase Drt2 n=1 Tax=Chitinimonas sp. BJYL2 TaxID=2976696 RepID=UPI0022B2F45D|nr:antiviral reverse transcriptase Drt2 [Chitinimonas sp. BJYL2]
MLDTPTWFRQRRYLHFDEPLSLQKAMALVTNPNAVATHAFWPLIRFNVHTTKIKQNKTTGHLDWHHKDREISYAAHSDSLIFGFYAERIGALYELHLAKQGLADCVLAFRSLGKNNINFAKSAFDEISVRGNCVAVALDVTKFFDTIDHAQLKLRWKQLLGISELPSDHFAVYKALTKFAYVDRDEVFGALGISVHNPRGNGKYRLCSPTNFRGQVRDAKLIKTNPNKCGIPQGTAISALLSNVYMLEFDAVANAFATAHGGKYMRYCDDILFVMPVELASETESFCISEIGKLELKINPDKTDTCVFTKNGASLVCNKPLQYLGFLFDGQQTIIRSAAFAKFSNHMKRGVSLAKQTMRSRNKAKIANGADEKTLYRRKLLSRYSHLGSRNFLRYGYKAAKVMNSKAIRRQLRPLWGRLQRAIEK